MLQALRWSLTHLALRQLGEAWIESRTNAVQPSRIDLRQVARVLVVRLDSVGDVVLMSPFLRELRANLPRAWITLLVTPATANLVELCPYVDEVLAHEPASSRHMRAVQAASRALSLARSHLWPRRFDLAVVPRWDVDSQFGAMAAYLSRAPQRIGYSESVSREKSRLNAGLDRLLTHPVRGEAPAHEVERNLRLIRELGGKVREDVLELWCGKEDENFADLVLKAHGVTGSGPLIALAPGAGHAKRMWPLSGFIELGAWLTTRMGAKLVLFGNPAEEPLGRELLLRVGGAAIDVVGRTSLREAGALLRRCDLFVGNDSGLMHLAAAAGVPIVEISCHPLGGSSAHANSPARFGPWRAPQVILRPAHGLGSCLDACNSSTAHCIEGVSIEQVKQAIALLLDAHSAQPGS